MIAIDFAEAEATRKALHPQLIQHSAPLTDADHFKPQWFETVSGKHIYPLVPDAALVNVGDITHALSHCCRFAGHCRQFYSVATHSILVMELVNSQTDCLHTQAAALMHDASEAYLHDITRPLKMSSEMSLYRILERQWECEIMHKLGIDADRVDWALIKDADNEALRLETFYLMPSRGKSWTINVTRSFDSMDYFFDPDGMIDMTPSDTRDEFALIWNESFTLAMRVLS